MAAIHKKIKFRKDTQEYFHFNFTYQVHGLFPELDWLMINYHLNHLADYYKIEMHAFVMMSTHCHLLFKTSCQSENYFSDHLLKELKISGAEDAYVEPIQNIAQYLNCYKYIYRNPIDAGLAGICEEYRFSSLHGLLGRSELATAVIDPLSIAQDPLKILNWLNNSSEKKLFYFRAMEAEI